jgi:hypothetical protein
MAKKIFYEKVGRKYEPVYEYDQTLMDAMPKGAHLIMCYPGGKSTRYNVNIDYAPMIAAGRVAEEAMLSAMHKRSEGRPSKVPLTERQRKAWEELKEAFGDDMFYITYPSPMDIVEEGLKAMQDEATKLMTNPSVKKAYEHFLLVCELTKENENG